jgi:hypothetical protein
MFARAVHNLPALCGILGVVMLIPSFLINPGPPPNPTVSQLVEFGHRYHNAIVIGAWLQAVSPFLIILFALAIVLKAGAATRLVGWMTVVGGVVLVMTSLVEVMLYLAAANGNPATTGLISLDLIAALQHVYSMVAAPAVFLPLGVIIVGSRVLPHVFGYLAFVLAGIFAALGIAGLFSPLQGVVNVLAGVQGLWWLFAAIVILARAGEAPNAAWKIAPTP